MTDPYDDVFTDTLLFGSKLCPTCRLPKPRNSDYFDRDARSGDGLQSACKVCRSERSHRHRASEAA